MPFAERRAGGGLRDAVDDRAALVALGKNAGCCSKLRWKGMFIDAEPDPSIPNTRDGMYWCCETMTCLGPDRRVADEESCCDGRRCFEPW